MVENCKGKALNISEMAALISRDKRYTMGASIFTITPKKMIGKCTAIFIDLVIANQNEQKLCYLSKPKSEIEVKKLRKSQ